MSDLEKPVRDNLMPTLATPKDLILHAQITNLKLTSDMLAKLSLTIMEDSIPERETIEATMPFYVIHDYGYQLGDKVTIRVIKT